MYKTKNEIEIELQKFFGMSVTSPETISTYGIDTYVKVNTMLILTDIRDNLKILKMELRNK